jgi:hypothetical protein
VPTPKNDMTINTNQYERLKSVITQSAIQFRLCNKTVVWWSVPQPYPPAVYLYQINIFCLLMVSPEKEIRNWKEVLLTSSAKKRIAA